MQALSAVTSPHPCRCRAPRIPPQRFYRWAPGANFPPGYNNSILIAQRGRRVACPAAAGVPCIGGGREPWGARTPAGDALKPPPPSPCRAAAGTATGPSARA